MRKYAYVFLGMALQAFITCLLWEQVSAGQQKNTGIIFSLASLIFFIANLFKGKSC